MTIELWRGSSSRLGACRRLDSIRVRPTLMLLSDQSAVRGL